MTPELILSVEIPAAARMRTRKASLDFVGSLVFGQIRRFTERPPAYVTFQGFLPRMYSFMHS